MCFPSKSVIRRCQQHCFSQQCWLPQLPDSPTSVLGLPFQGPFFSQKQTAINLIIEKCQINPFTAKKKILLMLQSQKIQTLNHLDSQWELKTEEDRGTEVRGAWEAF